MSTDITKQLALEIKASEAQIRAAVELLDGGATVPFIARYRKEVTGGLDDTQLRELEVRLAYLREMAERRTTIIKTIEAQGKMTPALLASLVAAVTKQELEDLYAPYKVKRRTKAQIAKEAGLEPLADLLFADPRKDPSIEALPFVQAVKPEDGGDFTSVTLVLDGVRDILSERWAEDAKLVQTLREWLWSAGDLQSKLLDGKDQNNPDIAKFKDYFDYAEPLSRVPSHRALAVFRGRTQELLDVKVVMHEDDLSVLAQGRIAQHLGWSHQSRAADDLLKKCVMWTWRVKLSLSTERDLLTRLREQAEGVAVKVFGDNLRDLLLAAPAGRKVVMGLDPGIRTGVKVAVVDATGKLLDTATVYPHEPRRDWDGSLHTLARLAQHHRVELIAIGNGTASRETEKLAGELIAKFKANNVIINKVVVSEAGASVYSASEYAAKEFPELDVSLRGAVSIARRLQDPLAELVKIDPKSIGVGQYQHDLNQSELARTLDTVVEDCVNGVGVDLNTASVPLLTRVAGVSGLQAKSIVAWREVHGAFTARSQLKKVAGLGEKTFEQCAGFLRITGGDNALDGTGVHPESYSLVEQLLNDKQWQIADVFGKADKVSILRDSLRQSAAKTLTNEAGKFTVSDILSELEKPGRDPRPDFQLARYSEGVSEITDLKVGMVLEGTVSNVAQFGAFVDLGVHQDGLVHVSAMSRNFVKDAREVVKTGQVVRVKVMELDIPRKRIGLSMRLDDAPGAKRDGASGTARPTSQAPRGLQGRDLAPVQNSMMAAFAKLKQ